MLFMKLFYEAFEKIKHTYPFPHLDDKLQFCSGNFVQAIVKPCERSIERFYQITQSVNLGELCSAVVADLTGTCRRRYQVQILGNRTIRQLSIPPIIGRFGRKFHIASHLISCPITGLYEVRESDSPLIDR